jgi:hypothetical protein
VLRPVGLRVRLLLLAPVLALLVTGCSAGTSAVEGCVEHSVEEGVDRTTAQEACAAAVQD